MNTNPTPALEDVLDDFALANPRLENVSEWTKRYPYYADAIRAFAEEWFALADVSESKIEDIETDAFFDDRNRFVKKGITLMQQRLDEVQPSPPPKSIQELLSLRSISTQQLRSKLGLSRRFYDSIIQHPVKRETQEAKTIWNRLIFAFSQLLDAPQEWITPLLDISARPSQSFSHTDSRPQSGGSVDLIHLVNNDSKLNEQMRHYLLTGKGPIPGMDKTDE